MMFKTRIGFLALFTLLSTNLIAQTPAATDGCKEAIQEVVADGAQSTPKKKSWPRRHPIWATLAIAVPSLVGYITPVWPGGGYTTESPALRHYQKLFDSSSYQGPKNNAQLTLFSVMQHAWMSGANGFIPEEISSQATDQEIARYKLLQHFQPTLFQDRVATSEPLSLQDTPVHPLAKLNQGELPKPAIFGQVKETLTHTFLIYSIFYPTNNFDAAKVSGFQKLVPLFPAPTKFNHTYDVEVVVEVLSKNSSGLVREATLTHRHGMMNAHSNNPRLQAHMRAVLSKKAFSGSFLGGDKQNISFGYFYQPNAIFHDTGEKIETLTASNGTPRGSMIFSSRMGHATYPVNLEAWRKGHGNGPILAPENSKYNQDGVSIQDAATTGIIPTRLYDWDTLMEKARGSDLFTGNQEAFEIATSQGVLVPRSGNPQSFAPPAGENAETVLAAGSRGRSPYTYAIPHAVWDFLTTGFEDRQEISDVYTWNNDVELKK